MAKLQKRNKRDKDYIADRMINNLRWEAIRARLEKSEENKNVKNGRKGKKREKMILVREKPVPKHWM